MHITGCILYLYECMSGYMHAGVCVCIVGRDTIVRSNVYVYHVWYVLVWLWHTPGHGSQFPFHSTEHSYSNNTSNGCGQQDTSNEASNGSTHTSTETATCCVCIIICVGRIAKSREVHSYTLAFAEWARNMSNMLMHAHFNTICKGCRTSQLRRRSDRRQRITKWAWTRDLRSNTEFLPCELCN